MTWNDIDFDNKTIKINKTAQYIAKEGIIVKEPKTKSSVREIIISNGLVEILKKWKTAQSIEKLQLGEQWKHGDKIFLFHPDSISKWYSNFMKRNNLGNPSLHKLRHANITLQLYMRSRSENCFCKSGTL